MLKSIAIAATFAAASFGTGAIASTMTFDATSAQSELYPSQVHSMWSASGFGALGQHFDFSPAGKFVVNDDETGDVGGVTASLDGTVVSANDDESGFSLSFQYDNDLTVFGAGPSFKSEQGSSENDSTYFLSLLGGTLEGFGALAGANFYVEAMPVPGISQFATQIGFDANNKNSNYGLANWFFFRADDNCSSNYCSALAGTQGDINIDLEAVPLPATGMLLFAGFASLAGIRRFKK